jgi:hypothetical protein
MVVLLKISSSIVAVSPSIHLPDPRAWDQKSRDILILCLNKQVQRLPGVYAQGQASQAGSRSKTATCLFETSLFSKHNKLDRTLPSFSKGSNSICPVPWTNQWKEIVSGQLSSRLLLLLFPCTEARRGGSARLSESPDEQLLIQDFSLGELSTLLISSSKSVMIELESVSTSKSAQIRGSVPCFHFTTRARLHVAL